MKGRRVSLDAFQWYLIAINVIALILYTIGFHIYQKTGGEFKQQGLLNFSTMFGGALGTMISYLIWDRTLKKNNMLSRIYTTVWLVIQLIVVLAVYGPNREHIAIWFHAFYSKHTLVCVYIIAITAIISLPTSENVEI